MYHKMMHEWQRVGFLVLSIEPLAVIIFPSGPVSCAANDSHWASSVGEQHFSWNESVHWQNISGILIWRFERVKWEIERTFAHCQIAPEV